MNATSERQVIRAEISDNFFEIIDRLFDNSPRTVCAELIQNARRAGASTIDFRLEHVGEYEGLNIRVTDDGAGIDNMADLLRIRGSGWSEETRRKEDPAGMGFFCLSRMNNLLVRSKGREVFMGEYCEALKGQVDAVVEDTDDFVAGTVLEFDWPFLFAHQLREAVQEVGRHAPIHVSIDGKSIAQDDIRPRAVLAEFENEDVKVYIHRRCYGEKLLFNFHGLTVEDSFPHNIEDFCAIVEVKDTSKLQLVLPARNAIVRNVYYRELLETIQKHIYEVIASEGSHGLPYKRWAEAKALGVELPPASAKLSTWETGDFQFVELDATRTPLIMSRSNHRGKFETVSAALEEDGRFCLYSEDKNMQGYDWYDAIQVVTGASYEKDGEPLDRINGTLPMAGLGVRVTLDWLFEESMVFSAPILIGQVAYGGEYYNAVVDRAGGFYIDPKSSWSEEDLCKIIDAAWHPGYISDQQKKEWNRQRTLDVRRCMGDATEALEYALRTAMQEALASVENLASYGGSVITLKCTVDEEGHSTLERV